MIEIRRILCPIDFSDCSRRAVDHALATAKWYESTITLLHVCAVVPTAAYAPADPILPSMVLTQEDREELLASMRRVAAAEAAAGVPIEFEVGEGNAATEILARAKATSSDLIVMGTHGRAGFERLVLGSVTEKVLRKAACPVLTVPPHLIGVVPTPSVLYRCVVCAVDFSDCSVHALNYAMSLAQEARARLIVVHVIEMPPDTIQEEHETMLGSPRSLREYVAAAGADRLARLQDAIPESVRAYCIVDTVLATGKPYREILRVAAEQKGDLIVIGIQGRGAADLLFFGSTAQHVVRQATCPVLTLRRR